LTRARAGRWFPFAPVALGALASLLLAGCTAVGFGVGALYDMQGGKRTVGELASVRTGTSITMWLRDGRKLDGEFLGCRDSLGATPLTAPTDVERGSFVPLRALVVLGTQSGPQQIPIDLVERISVPVVRGKVVGTLVGLLGDAWLFYLAWITNTGGIQD
jgi:hypothetical protein